MSFILGQNSFWDSNACYVIAEVGNNHNGSLERAKQLVDAAKEMGVDCVKFQMRNLKKVYREKTLAKLGDDLSAEYTIDLLKKFELSFLEHKELFEYCKKREITYLCTPWDDDSVDALMSFGVEAFKVASADLTNLPLLEKLISTGKFLILSTGMSQEWEIRKVVEFLEAKNVGFCLLHCNSTYPAPFHGINLNYLTRLKGLCSRIGYSGHERGTAVSLAAVGLGARVIERHLTSDRDMEGPDHAASLEPRDFQSLVAGIREIEEALGSKGEKIVSQGEMINRENLAKSVVASRDLKKGQTIARDDLLVRSPGQGLSPIFIPELMGTVLKRDIGKEEYFFKSDLQGGVLETRKYSFTNPYGIPVRYHDFNFFLDKLKNADLVEFHLSYSDMDLKLEDFFQGTYPLDFVVHAPELFQGSHLMDLATDDKAYRDYSIQETQKVINITRSLKKYFPKTSRPMIVANVGGFSRDEVFSEEKKKKLYERFLTSLKELDREGVEIIPQTMAPFPWHFGGQRHQNIFVHADEIVAICQAADLRICLDVSHTRLAANHFGFDFYDYVAKVAPFTAHLHLGDSKGVDGEGLQIGDGDIDFVKLGKIIKEKCPHASFIPEIWQGHKDGGQGFWLAFERLEKHFA